MSDTGRVSDTGRIRDDPRSPRLALERPRPTVRRAVPWRRVVEDVARSARWADHLLLLPLALWLVSRLPLPAGGGAIVAVGLSFSLPLALGLLVTAATSQVFAGRRLPMSVPVVGVAYAVGLVLLPIGAQAASIFGLFSPRSIGLGILFTATIGWAGLAVHRYARRRDRASAGDDTADDAAADAEASRVATSRAGTAAAYLIVALAGVALAAWYRWDSPPPFHPSWDAFVHLRVIDGLLERFWSLWTTDYSTAFRINAYFPTHHLTVAMASTLTGIPPLDVYWAGPFVVMPVVGIACAAIALRVGATWLSAAVAAAVAIVAVFPFQAAAFLGLLPLTSAVVLLPVVMLVVISGLDWRRRAALVVILSAGVVATHWFLGLGVLAFGLAGVAIREIGRRTDRLAPVTIVGIAVITLVLALGYLDIWQLPGGTAVDTADDQRWLTRELSLETRQRDIERRVSGVVLAASAAGAVLLARRRTGWGGRRHTYIATIWLGTVGVLLLLPLAGVDRGIVALPAVLAPTIGWLVTRLGDMALRPGDRLGERGVLVGSTVAIACVLAFLPAADFRTFQQGRADETSVLSSFSPSEDEAAVALRGLVPGSALVVSDPVTQEIFGGLGNREAFGGGPFATNSQLEGLQAALLEPNGRKTWEALTALTAEEAGGEPVILVVTGRTADWLDGDPTRWVGYHQLLGPQIRDSDSPVGDLLHRISNPTYFDPIWRSDDVVIVGVRSEPGPASEAGAGQDVVGDVAVGDVAVGDVVVSAARSGR